MTERKLSEAEAFALWREAERRLRLVDVEPPVSMARVDALLGVLGARQEGESITDWLKRSRKAPVAETRPSAEIIQFSARRQRFTPVAEITRLAADTSGPDLPLPSRELETADGRFRLKVAIEGDQVMIAVQALGLAADEFANRTLGIAGAGADAEPVALLQLDEDGDGSVRLPDTPELRRALLKPVIGLVEDV
jgi:hypothetical protein